MKLNYIFSVAIEVQQLFVLFLSDLVLEVRDNRVGIVSRVPD